MQLPEDTYMHKGQRRKLLDELRDMGIADERVLEAMDRVPRHFFLDSAFSQFAYTNKAFPIAAGQTISQPHTVAKQSELLAAKPGDTVLEIGTGSGYQCAVLCALGLKVHSIERQKALFDTAGPLLKAMGLKPALYYGDGYKGKPVFAPFDGIIITCGAPDVPQALLGQLKVGGAHGHSGGGRRHPTHVDHRPHQRTGIHQEGPRKRGLRSHAHGTRPGLTAPTFEGLRTARQWGRGPRE